MVALNFSNIQSVNNHHRLTQLLKQNQGLSELQALATQPLLKEQK
jgi:hypothetical protein